MNSPKSPVNPFAGLHTSQPSGFKRCLRLSRLTDTIVVPIGGARYANSADTFDLVLTRFSESGRELSPPPKKLAYSQNWLCRDCDTVSAWGQSLRKLAFSAMSAFLSLATIERTCSDSNSPLPKP